MSPARQLRLLCFFFLGRVGLVSSDLYTALREHCSALTDRLCPPASRTPGMLHPLRRMQLLQPRHLQDTANTSAPTPSSQHPSAICFSQSVPASFPAQRPPGSPATLQRGSKVRDKTHYGFSPTATWVRRGASQKEAS